MKKVLAILLLCAGSAVAAPRLGLTYVDTLGPAASALTAGTNTVSIASSTVTGARNCLTNVEASVRARDPQTSITLSVLDIATTVYAVDAATGTIARMFFPPENPLCIGPNHVLNLTVINAVTTSSTTLNYMGYTY